MAIINWLTRGQSAPLRDAHSRGAALINSLLLMTLLSALGMVAITTTTTEVSMSANYRSSIQALHAAEAGIYRLLGKLRTTPTLYTETTTMADMALLTAKPDAPNLGNLMAYWYPTLNYEASSPPLYVDVESHGTAFGTSSLAKVSARIAYTPPNPFDYGLFADDGIEFGGGGGVDSYNACEAPYDPNNPGTNGDIGTNATGEDTIVMNGNGSLIQGDAAVGVGGDPASDITGNGTITGTTTALTHAKEIPPKSDPGGATFTHLDLSSHTEETLTTGTYEHPYVTIEGHAKLYIDGDVTMSVQGDLRTAGHGQIIIKADSSLSIYVSGDVTIEGGGVVNQTALPSSLMLYGTATSEEIRIAGNSDFYGVVYAPTAEVEVEGNSDLYGAVVGQTLSIASHIHYDECLGNGSGSAQTSFRIVSWRRH